MWPVFILIAGIVLWALAVANPLGLVLTIVGGAILAIQLVFLFAAVLAAASIAKSAKRRF